MLSCWLGLGAARKVLCHRRAVPCADVRTSICARALAWALHASGQVAVVFVGRSYETELGRAPARKYAPPGGEPRQPAGGGVPLPGPVRHRRHGVLGGGRGLPGDGEQGACVDRRHPPAVHLPRAGRDGRYLLQDQPHAGTLPDLRGDDRADPPDDRRHPAQPYAGRWHHPGLGGVAPAGAGDPGGALRLGALPFGEVRRRAGQRNGLAMYYHRPVVFRKPAP